MKSTKIKQQKFFKFQWSLEILSTSEHILRFKQKFYFPNFIKSGSRDTNEAEKLDGTKRSSFEAESKLWREISYRYNQFIEKFFSLWMAISNH